MESQSISFDGATFDQQRDGERLKTQLEQVRHLMSDGQWRTLAQIHTAIPASSEAGISARLRDLRKTRHGSWKVERVNAGGGLWKYRALKS